MLIDTPAYTEAVKQSRYLSEFKKFLANRVKQCFEPDYFVTIYYGRSFRGDYLSPSEYRKRWDKTEVIKTHKFIRSLLRKCYPDIHMVFCMERHKETHHPIWGDMKGAFHTHLYLSGFENMVHKTLKQMDLNDELRKLIAADPYLTYAINSNRISFPCKRLCIQ